MPSSWKISYINGSIFKLLSSYRMKCNYDIRSTMIDSIGTSPDLR